MSDLLVYKKTALTGGGATALDGVDGAALVDGNLAFVTYGGVIYNYILDDDSGATESSPDVIAPVTNPGKKRWLLQHINPIGVDMQILMSKGSTNPQWAGPPNENITEIIQYPLPTSGYMLKAAADGSPATATNTDTDVADAVTKKHTQNTDTGTTATSFKINTGGSEADLQTTGLTADRDYTFPDIDTKLAGSVLTAQNIVEIIEYTP
jgi:hypothetical protein